MPAGFVPPQGRGETVTLGELNIAANSLIHVDSSSNAQRIADVAVGQVFISGGISTVPAWSAAPVVTTLDVTNIRANDGTAAIVIADSTGVVTLTTMAVTNIQANDGTASIVIADSTGIITTKDQNISNSADVGRLNLKRTGLTTAGGIARIYFFGETDGGAEHEYGSIQIEQVTTTAGSEETSYEIWLDKAGTMVRHLYIDTTSGQFVIDNSDVTIDATKKLYFDGGGDTYLVESASNVFMIVVGGSEILEIQNNFVFQTTTTATGRTSSYFGIPRVNGVPTGVPANVDDKSRVMTYDTVNNDFYVYNAGWKKVAMA